MKIIVHNIKVEESLMYRLLLLQRMSQSSASLALALRQSQVCMHFFSNSQKLAMKPILRLKSTI